LLDPGVALLLLQEPADGARPVPRARPLHPADQAQEHAALAQGRGADHPPRHRVLREGVSVAQYVVTAAGLGAIAWVLWYFLFERGGGPAVAASLADGVQEVHVTVKGGYTPDTIVVQAGKPVRLQFYRDETADCSERLVLEDFGLDVALPAFQTTTVEVTPEGAGEFRLRCRVNMLTGLLEGGAGAGARRRPDEARPGRGLRRRPGERHVRGRAAALRAERGAGRAGAGPGAGGDPRGREPGDGDRHGRLHPGRRHGGSARGRGRADR